MPVRRETTTAASPYNRVTADASETQGFSNNRHSRRDHAASVHLVIWLDRNVRRDKKPHHLISRAASPPALSPHFPHDAVGRSDRAITDVTRVSASIISLGVVVNEIVSTKSRRSLMASGPKTVQGH